MADVCACERSFVRTCRRAYCDSQWETTADEAGPKKKLIRDRPYPTRFKECASSWGR